MKVTIRKSRIYYEEKDGAEAEVLVSGVIGAEGAISQVNKACGTKGVIYRILGIEKISEVHEVSDELIMSSPIVKGEVK